MSNLKDIELKFAKADKQVAEAKEFLNEYLNFLVKYRDKVQVFKDLESFYHSGDWNEERDELYSQEPVKHYDSAGEDTIWDIGCEFRNLNINFLKSISDYLHSEVS